MTLNPPPCQLAIRLSEDDPLPSSPTTACLSPAARRPAHTREKKCGAACASGQCSCTSGHQHPGRDPQRGPACARPLPAVGSFRHEPRPGEADEAPERGEDNDRESEGVRRHSGARDLQVGVQMERQVLRTRRSQPGSERRACAAGQGRPGKRAPPGRSAQTRALAHLSGRGAGGWGRGARCKLTKSQI